MRTQLVRVYLYVISAAAATATFASRPIRQTQQPLAMWRMPYKKIIDNS